MFFSGLGFSESSFFAARSNKKYTKIYEGEREYESLAAFAKERIGKPVCSIHYVEHCSEDEKVIIDGLRTKPREELEALESSVADRVQAAQEIYDASVEDLSARFEEITTKFNSEIDAIRAETNFKWVQQILSSLSNDHDPEATDEVNDEL